MKYRDIFQGLMLHLALPMTAMCEAEVLQHWIPKMGEAQGLLYQHWQWSQAALSSRATSILFLSENTHESANPPGLLVRRFVKEAGSKFIFSHKPFALHLEERGVSGQESSGIRGKEIKLEVASCKSLVLLL